MENYKLLTKYKTSVYVITGAFFISLIIGFLTGNPAGIVLMRAFLSAILFVAIFQGGVYIIKKYIPEIGNLTEVSAETVEKDAGVDAEDSEGKIIDYTIDDEAYPISFENEETEPVIEGEVKTVHPEGEETRVHAEDASINGVTEQDVEDKEDASLSELPSLDNLFENEDEQTTTENDIRNEGSKGVRSEKGDYIQVGNAQIPNEPENLAKAIKKVMNEDESG